MSASSGVNCMHKTGDVLEKVACGSGGVILSITTLALAILGVTIALGGLAGGCYAIYFTAVSNPAMIPLAILVLIPKVVVCGFIGYGLLMGAGGTGSLAARCFQKVAE